MPSKGVDFYGFIAKGYELEIRKADAGNKDNPDVIQQVSSDSVLRFFSDHYEINTNHWKLRYEGRFQFIARKDGRQLFERSLRINGDTGNIDNDDINNMRIGSVTGEDFTFSFGLYDSDSSDPDSHQVYATLTPKMKNWQGNLFKSITGNHAGDLEKVFLKNLVLPGSHDAGMYTDMLTELSNMANTQRDNIGKQLELGARYFDFRPGKLRKEVVPFLHEVKKHKSSILGVLQFFVGASFMLEWFLNNKLNDIIPYFASQEGKTDHIHAIVPGENYFNFIREIVSFLEGNKEEIVVVHIADSGIIREFDVPDVKHVDIMVEGVRVNGKKVKLVDVPSKSELEAETQTIFSNTTIKTGDKTSFGKSIKALLENNERLIILYREESIDIADTYTDDYTSFNKDVVTSSVEKVLKDSNDTKDLVKLQLQLTPTGVNSGIMRALKGTNKCTSPLYATKPRTDKSSYRLLLDKADDIKKQKGLVVAQNDFYDNALTGVVVALNEYKAGIIHEIKTE